MDEAFHRDPFSFCFNVLRYLGQWNVNELSKSKQNLYQVYRFLMVVNNVEIATLGLIDLYYCGRDIKKIVYNICTTMLTIGITIKNFHLMLLSGRVDKLRLKLFNFGRTHQEPEDIAIVNYFKSRLLFLGKAFFIAVSTLLPIWLATSLVSLKWGPRELPFPAYLPLDLNKNVEFSLGFIHCCWSAMYIVAETLFSDLAMYSILLSITAQFKILAKNMRKIDALYKNPNYDESKRVDREMVKYKTKKMLKESVSKQLELMTCVRELEFIYNIPMMLQLITCLFLSIANGLEVIVASVNFSFKLSYQVGYTLLVLGDIFMVCYLADLLLKQSEEINSALYCDITWYEMDNDLKKDLLLIFTGSRKIRPLTAGKMFKLNLPTSLALTKNVYSGLAMFRQLVMKK